jgi:sodium-coupled neutral amino acid transporter 11
LEARHQVTPSLQRFPDKSLANVLNIFNETSGLFTFCRLLFAVSLYMTYPLDCLVAREVMEKACFPRTTLQFPGLVHVMLTLAIVFTTTAVTLTCDDLGVVLGLTGGISASALAFVFPAACYLRLFKEDGAFKRSCAGALIGFGLLVMVQAIYNSCTA